MTDDRTTPAESDSILARPADVAALSFQLRATWRPSLPDDPPADALVLRRVEFESDPTAPTTNQFDRDTRAGTPAETTIRSGTGAFSTAGTSRCSERFLFSGRLPAPHVSTVLRVADLDGRARPTVGLETTDGDVAVTVDGESGQIRAAASDDGSVLDEGEVPTAPFDLLVTWLGTSAVVCTRPADGRWTVHGRFAWSGDPYANWADSPARPWWGYDLASDASIAVDEVSLLGTAGFGVRDPALVTHRDGTPLVEGRHVYLACTAGAPGFGYSYQCVLRLHVDTFDVELVGLLFADTADGSCYPDNAAHVVYDDRADEFVVAFSGFGTRHLGGDDAVRIFVGRTGRNVLSGVHTVEVDPANLPTQSQAWDPYLVFDERAGAWRCAHTYDGAGALAVSETTDESLTDGWDLVSTVEGPNEGTKLLPADDGFLCLYTDEREPAGMAVSEYPEIGQNSAPLGVHPPTEARFDTGFTSHPMVIPIDERGETRHLLVGFDGSEFAGLDIDPDGRKRTRGALYVYESR